jgi:hypothetical protein
LSIQCNAVESATINFLERYPIILETGKTLQNCESFVHFSFLTVFKDFGCYVLSLNKSKFGNNRVIQASGLNGPIPPGIAFWENLTDLSVSIFYFTAFSDGIAFELLCSLLNLICRRISDLNGSEEPFPRLDNLKQLETL